MEDTVLEELVRANAALTTTNTEFSASVASLINANEKLSCWVGNRQGNQNQNTWTREDTPSCPKTIFTHFKTEVMHAHDSCFELNKKSARQLRGWKSRLWRRGASKIVDKVNELGHSPLSALLPSYICSPPLLIQSITRAKNYTKTQSEIVDSGASGYFFAKNSPKNNVDSTAPLILVGTASGQPMTSASTCDLAITQLSSEFPTTVHVVQGLQDNLVSVGPMCDANFTGTFTKHAVNIYSTNGTPIVTGWHEITGPRLWSMSIMPNPVNMPPLPDNHKTTTPQAFSAYDLPSDEALMRYFHAAPCFPVCDTWLKSTKAGNFASCTGLIYQNAAKAVPTTNNTPKGNMVQVRQGVFSTKPNRTRS